MADPRPARRYRFGTFEADAVTAELRRQGIRIRLTGQPFQILLMLLDRPGELLTREQIFAQLWPEGTFVDYEHGVNSAVNRIREALGDTAGNPRFIETLARRGYRFVAPVERIGPPEAAAPAQPGAGAPKASTPLTALDAPPPTAGSTTAAPLTPALTDEAPYSRKLRILASADELPTAPHRVVRTLFLALQLMYLAFYAGALANLAEIDDLLSALTRTPHLLTILIVTAAVLIPVRAFVLSATLFHAPAAGAKFLRIWPLLLPLDVFWALSPFLLLHHINFGTALACTALLLYSPFAQRSLILMGAARSGRQTTTTL